MRLSFPDGAERDDLEMVAALGAGDEVAHVEGDALVRHEGDALVVVAAGRHEEVAGAVFRAHAHGQAAILVGLRIGIIGAAVADLGAGEGQPDLCGVGGADDHRIGTGAEIDRVGAVEGKVGECDIVAVAAVDDVVGEAAGQRVVAVFAVEHVIVYATVQRVVAIAPEELVVVVLAEQAVVSAPSEEAIVAVPAENRVVAPPTVQPVVAAAALDDAVAQGLDAIGNTRSRTGHDPLLDAAGEHAELPRPTEGPALRFSRTADTIVSGACEL